MLKLSSRTRIRRSNVHHKASVGSTIGRAVRNVVLSTVILLALVIGGGIAYTWYVGQHDVADVQAAQQPAKSATSTIKKPTQPKPDARVSASVQLLTSPVTPGSNASITVKTNAGANCTIKVEYNKIASKDSGLVAKTADEFGMVSWAWTVEDTAALGKAPVTITCANTKKSAMVIGDLQVVKTLPTVPATPTAMN